MWSQKWTVHHTEGAPEFQNKKIGWTMNKLTKKERTASIVAGAILFILAAVFTLAIFIKIFAVSSSADGNTSLFFKLGHMLYSAYGYCSLLIPLFFIVAGSFCFDSRWSVQRALCLVVSPIPFFTLVGAEHLIRASATNDSHAIAFVKITLLAVVSLLLIAVEYLITIIMAGKLRKKMASSTKTDVTSAPVFNSAVDSDDEETEKRENKITKFFSSIAEKIKSLTEKNSAITSAPIESNSKTFDPESTVEIVLEEEKNQQSQKDYNDEDLDDSFQEPTISDDFFEEKQKLLVSSGDDEINQIDEDEDEPKSLGQKIAGPFKKLFKNVQNQYKDLMDYGDIQDKENPSPILNSLTKKESGDKDQEAVDINDFFKKPAERVVLKESDYSDLDLPPRSSAREELNEIESSYQARLENINQQSDEEKIDDKNSPDENYSDDYEEQISIDEFNSADEPEENSEEQFAEFSDDEEDIIGMFERQNQNLQDNDFLSQIESTKTEEEDSPLDSFVDNETYSDEIQEPISAEEIQEENENSFLTQIRERVNARANQKTPAQLKAEEEQRRAEKEQAEKELAQQQKKIQEEKLFARIREELKAQTKKSEEAEYSPEVKSEVSTAGSGLSDVFERMNEDVKNRVDTDPAYKARFKPQIPVQQNPEPKVETKPEPEYKPEPKVEQEKTVTVQQPVTKDEEIVQKHRSFIARAEAIKAAKEAEQKASQTKEEPISVQQKQEVSEDYVFGNNEPGKKEFHSIDPLAGSVDIDEEVFDDEETEEIDAQDFLNDDSYESEENIQEESQDDDFDSQEISFEDESENSSDEQNQNDEPDDYVFPSAKVLPPKPNGWNSVYNIPYNLLTAYENNPYWEIDDETKAAALNLKNTLAEFKIEADVTGIQKGPVVTMFEILPAPGVKLNRIVALADNIALRLAASSVRIVAPIPGKHAVGIEVPNKSRAIISIRECLEQEKPEWSKMGVPVVLGKDIQGNTQIIDLVKTPHLLIAGATGAGKSVCVNSMILSMLYKRNPRDVKMILIDPKIVELKLYNDIPHLLTPVITEPKKAMQALQYCLCEMERRYALLDGMSVRDISSYNKKITEKHIATEKLPYLIVIIDEFADLMATTGKQLEGVLARLCAMSRAVGIHLVLATQRPSIDVITGLIKANIPSRIAFMVASKTDSRIILDSVGAEKLLGKGDMLYTSAADPFPIRIQGTFVSDQEVENVVEAVKSWGEPEYIDEEIFVDDDDEEDSEDVSLFNPDAEDPLYEKALDIVVQAGKASASYIQRRLKIGYNRAARLVEEMEERGIVGPANGSKPREIIHMP